MKKDLELERIVVTNHAMMRWTERIIGHGSTVQDVKLSAQRAVADGYGSMRLSRKIRPILKAIIGVKAYENTVSQEGRLYLYDKETRAILLIQVEKPRLYTVITCFHTSMPTRENYLLMLKKVAS